MTTAPPESERDLEPRASKSRSRSAGVGSLLEPMILTWRLFWDGRVPVTPKLIPLASVVYLLSPLDFVPELALGPIGIIDDLGLILLALNGFVALCPPEIVNEHRRLLGYSTSAPDNDNVVDGQARPFDGDPPS